MKTISFFSLLIGMFIGVNVFANQPLRVEITKSDVTCAGLSNGKAELYISGGVAPYTANWNNGMFGTTLDQLKKGTYVVTITDSEGTSLSDTVKISAPAPMALIYNTEIHGNVDNLNAHMNAMIIGGTPWEGSNYRNLYMVRVDGKSYYDHPEEITDGEHQLSFEDATGCTLSVKANLNVHLVGETSEFNAENKGLNTVELTVFPMHLNGTTSPALSQAY